MKRNTKNCRHSSAYPTVMARTAGFLWCPDCGAHRLIRLDRGSDEYSPAGWWIYPTGHADVVLQIKRQEKRWG